MLHDEEPDPEPVTRARGRLSLFLITFLLGCALLVPFSTAMPECRADAVGCDAICSSLFRVRVPCGSAAYAGLAGAGILATAAIVDFAVYGRKLWLRQDA